MNQVVKAFGTFLTSETGKWNTFCYDITISVHEVTNKILSRDSSNIVDVMGPNFGNSNISMRKVIIHLIL